MWGPVRILMLLTLTAAELTSGQKKECQVLQDRCDFPFEHNGQSKDSCVKVESDDRYLCKLHTADNLTPDGFAWGVCNSDCLDQETGGPLEFGGDMFSMSMFCKNQRVDCVFPFKYGGVEYHECTADIGDGSRPLCSTKVDDQGNAVDNFWGACDMDQCGAEEVFDDGGSPNSDKLQGGGKVASVKIKASGNPTGVTADITFIQVSKDADVVIKGIINGLSPGKHGIHIHEFEASDGDCLAAGPHFNPFNATHGDATNPNQTLYTTHPGDLGNVFANAYGTASVKKVLPNGRVSLFEDSEQEEVLIIGRTLVIHADEDDLGAKTDDPNSLFVGNSGERLACNVITLSYDTAESFNTTIMIVLILLLLLLILLVTVLLCYCCRKKKKQWTPLSPEGNKPGDDDELQYQNGGPRKKPLYDELSIPFIDASPVPSPKLGRSSNRAGNICATSEDSSP